MLRVRVAPHAMSAVDKDVLRWTAEHRNAGWTQFAKTLMNLGSSTAFLGSCVVVAVLLAVVLRAIRPAAAGGGAALVAVVASTALKHAIARPRPAFEFAIVHAAGYSMPSADAALVAALSVTVIVAARWPNPTWRCAAAAAAAVVNVVTGLALVYLGVHWMTDVVVGWALGAAIGMGVGVAARGRPTRRPLG